MKERNRKKEKKRPLQYEAQLLQQAFEQQQSDVLGSYLGMAADGSEPEQDADDL